jgi:hypothetical protein
MIPIPPRICLNEQLLRLVSSQSAACHNPSTEGENPERSASAMQTDRQIYSDFTCFTSQQTASCCVAV